MAESKKMASRDRIVAGKVPKRVADQVPDNQLRYWQEELTDGQRDNFYTSATADKREAQGLQMTHGNAHGGEQAHGGRGAALVDAIAKAWANSPTVKAQSEEAARRLREAPVTCHKCEKDFPGDGEVMTAGNRSTCYGCAWEHYPESAKMLGLPNPGGELTPIDVKPLGTPDAPSVGRPRASAKAPDHMKKPKARAKKSTAAPGGAGKGGGKKRTITMTGKTG